MFLFSPKTSNIAINIKEIELKIYITVILPVILYGCESWSTTLADEHKLRVFENKILRKLYGLKRGEMTGEWRRLESGGDCIMKNSTDYTIH